MHSIVITDNSTRLETKVAKKPDLGYFHYKKEMIIS